MAERLDEEPDVGCDLLWIPAWGYGWVMIRWHGLGFPWATSGRLKNNMIMMMKHLKLGHGHCHGLDEQGQRVKPAKRGSIKKGGDAASAADMRPSA